MNKSRVSLVVILVCLFGLAVFSGCSKKDDAQQEQNTSTQTEGQKQIKAGLLYIGNVGDAGWTFTHDEGRKAMETLPFVSKSTYVESAPVGADTVRLISSLVDKGHNLIFANSFGYMDAMVEVAAKYPNVTFMHCSGYKVSSNLGTYFGHIEEGRYLAGIVAGEMSEKGIIGYVAAYPIPEVIRGINSFTLGVRSVNPEATVRVVWTNTWYDPALERSAAESLINVGVDILTMHQDTPAVIQAANEKGVLSIGYNSDMSKYAPETFLTAPIWNWNEYYKLIATQVSDGTWTSSSDMWGMKEGLIDLAPYGPRVTDDVKALVEQKKGEIIAGTLSPFQGPIVDQAGNVRIPEGRAATPEEELSMDYLVKGVQGTVN